MKLLYVEDNADAAADLTALLARQGCQVVWEMRGADGLRRAALEQFDTIILDRMLPDMDGLEIVQRLRSSGVDAPVLMLSALGRASNRVEGLDAGVDDYLAKPYEPEELMARLKALVRRAESRTHSAIIIYGQFECHVKARTAFRRNVHMALSPKEFELFRYFMENAGEVVTRDMLLRDVWKMNFDPQTNVVDVNIGRLRRKLEAGFDKPALETIWGTGYRLTRGASPIIPASRSIFTAITRRATLFALGALALLFAVTGWQSWSAMERSLLATVDTDIAGLVDIYATGGESELLARLEDRSSVVSLDGRQARYMLVRPDGTMLGGNVRAWPTLGAGLSESGFLTLADGTDVFARATRLSPDLDLLVARTYERDRAALVRLALLFGGTALLIVLATWLLGRRAAGHLRRRIGAISTAFRDAELGREPSGTGDPHDDEIGELASYSTRAIGRSANLARTHRHMSDHIAHEIRTPLTHLDGRLVNAMRELPPECDPAVIEQCRRDIRGVVAMLDSLLDIASSEARVGDLAGLTEVDLSSLASDLADLYSGSAEEEGVTFRTFIEPGVTMMGEPMQLTRLLSNLLDNALKYVPRGGQVTLSVAKGPVIEVRDDGPGVEPSLRRQVFDRFRAGQAPSGKTSHGLGLALARAIALRHGLGIALVDSAVGAHFVIKPHTMWETGSNMGETK